MTLNEIIDNATAFNTEFEIASYDYAKDGEELKAKLAQGADLSAVDINQLAWAIDLAQDKIGADRKLEGRLRS